MYSVAVLEMFYAKYFVSFPWYHYYVGSDTILLKQSNILRQCQSS